MTFWQALGTLALIAGVLVTISIFAITKISDSSKWRGKVDSDQKTFKKFMEGIRADISEIRADIKEIFRVLPRRAAATNSPLQLTEWGREISATIDGEAWATKLALDIASQFEGRSPYEIQEGTRHYCMEELEMSKEKLALCRHCAYEQGAELEVVKQVLGLELRDVLLEKFGLLAPN